ncbi:hypothetical protein AGRHK599_LOCUS3604 [Rhizobium rhizogenes]|uniref:Uncharacterized protein n=1 Tax=Rhizobium rhizogenes TaxID=359 RepID=A0AAN2DEU3_RHIRH|nr:hypothetical protein AGRHK599_LOCUS3604 [Rhizobium rhizogenes]
MRSVGLSLRRLSSLIMHVSRNVCYWDFFAIRPCVPVRGIGQLPSQLQGSGHNDYAAEHLKRRLCQAGSNVGILVRHPATLGLTINDQDLPRTVRTRPTNTVPVSLVAFAAVIERECSVRVRSVVAQVTGTRTQRPQPSRGSKAYRPTTRAPSTSAPQARHRPETTLRCEMQGGRASPSHQVAISNFHSCRPPTMTRLQN